MGIEIQHATASPESSESPEHIAQDSEIQNWVNSVLLYVAAPQTGAGVTLRLVERAEIRTLNLNYRAKDAPTNVLAFPFEPVADIDDSYLGDIVICPDVVKTEAKQQLKSIKSHFAHIVIHGTLHLCGFDHQTDEQARKMEEVENLLLKDLGLK